MTEEEYIEMCAERGREEARKILKNYLKPFNIVLDNFRPMNNTVEEFQGLLKAMGYEGEFEYEEDS